MEADLDGLGLPFGPALSVVATVISRGPDRAILDAGRKSIAGDYGPPRPLIPGAEVTGFNEEHTTLRFPDPPAAPLPALGERVALRPGAHPADVQPPRRRVARAPGRVVRARAGHRPRPFMVTGSDAQDGEGAARSGDSAQVTVRRTGAVVDLRSTSRSASRTGVGSCSGSTSAISVSAVRARWRASWVLAAVIAAGLARVDDRRVLLRGRRPRPRLGHVDAPVALGVVEQVARQPVDPLARRTCAAARGTAVRRLPRVDVAPRELGPSPSARPQLGDRPRRETSATVSRTASASITHPRRVELLEVGDATARATRTRRFGSESIRPSRWSIRSASRSGVRLTPSRAASCTCESGTVRVELAPQDRLAEPVVDDLGRQLRGRAR